MRIAPRNIGDYLPVGRRTAVGVVLSTFALVLLIVTALVLSALSQVREKANLLDSARSRETTAGALVTFREQLGATSTITPPGTMPPNMSMLLIASTGWPAITAT